LRGELTGDCRPQHGLGTDKRQVSPDLDSDFGGVSAIVCSGRIGSFPLASACWGPSPDNISPGLIDLGHYATRDPERLLQDCGLEELVQARTWGGKNRFHGVGRLLE